MNGDGPRVLVTDGVMKKALAVVRSTSAVSSAVGVTSTYPVSTAGVSRFADAAYRIDRSDPATFVAELDRIVRSDGYDLVLPVGGRSFDVLSRHRDDLSVPVDGVLPPAESMRVATDKYDTYRRCVDAGVPVPETRRIREAGDLEGAAGAVGYPAVLKTATETEERFVAVVRDRGQLDAAYERLSRERSGTGLLQSYLPGESCGFFGLYLDGEFSAGYSHRRIREYPPSGGASACAESHRDEQLADYGRRILDDLDWNGVAMVEYKRDAEDVPRVVEINPKFWGSLDLAIASGLDFPAALVAHATGGTVPTPSFAERRVHWPLSGDLEHAVRRPDSAPAVVRDLVSRETRSNLRITDPLPHAVELLKSFA